MWVVAARLHNVCYRNAENGKLNVDYGLGCVTFLMGEDELGS